ncbi:hypothetical protein CA983_29180 [Streptomyces swartbergensis]|uniref:Uncharacterized protein n=1 Tax=Streptomyces swartbergensis TaxID=487165 RepID=A0A243RTK9_9ACTN|nr:hypothetical protein CA983_29180 [Streptomyces swartbergensis]
MDDHEDAQLHTAEPGDVVYPLLCALLFPAVRAPARAAASGLAHVRVAALLADMAVQPKRDRMASVPTSRRCRKVRGADQQPERMR